VRTQVAGQRGTSVLNQPIPAMRQCNGRRTAVLLALGYNGCMSTPVTVAADPAVARKANPLALQDVRGSTVLSKRRWNATGSTCSKSIPRGCCTACLTRLARLGSILSAEIRLPISRDKENLEQEASPDRSSIIEGWHWMGRFRLPKARTSIVSVGEANRKKCCGKF
jgi:hypothetical protein